MRLYDNQANASKTTLSLPPDEDSCCQHITAHCISFIWNNFDNHIIPTIDPYLNGWELKNGVSVPIWFVGHQLPLILHRQKKKKKSMDMMLIMKTVEKGLMKVLQIT